MVEAFQMKIPLFQKNSPVLTNTFANSAEGFSVKVFTCRGPAIRWALRPSFTWM